MLDIKDMSFSEIQKNLNKINEEASECLGECVFNRDFWDIKYELENNKDDFVVVGGTVQVSSLGIKVEVVDGYGGEDQGSDYWGVAKLEDNFGNKKFFKVSGWYASYHGAECEDPLDWQEVKPKEKTVIEYV